MKKRLIALMLAGLLTTGSLVGCSSNTVEEDVDFVIDLNEKEFGTQISVYDAGRIQDKCISVEQKDKYVLHKGDVVYYDNDSYRSSISLGVTKMKFDCGEELLSNATYYLSDEKPSEDFYDEICEDCFHQ